jgi:RNA polymerase sigma factor (sigma-70 family)
MTRERTPFVFESLFAETNGQGFVVREESNLATHETPESNLERLERIHLVRTLLETLSPREKDILTRHYGVNRDRESLTEIGRTYGLSKQRISQLEAVAKEELGARIRNRNN